MVVSVRHMNRTERPRAMYYIYTEEDIMVERWPCIKYIWIYVCMYVWPRLLRTLTCDKPHILLTRIIITQQLKHQGHHQYNLLRQRKVQIGHLAITEIKSFLSSSSLYTYDNNCELKSSHAENDWWSHVT
jgi:hypothetical protein